MRVRLIGIGVCYVLLLLFSIFVIAGAKKRAFGHRFIRSDTDVVHGELYEMCKINRFREDIALMKGDATGKIEDADIITIGDSFFGSALASRKFAAELEAVSGRPVYHVENTGKFNSSQVDMPLAYLESISCKRGPNRVLVLESVERYAAQRAKSCQKSWNDVHSWKSDNGYYKERILDTKDIEYFFSNNILSGTANKFLQNVRFDLLGIVNLPVVYHSEVSDMLFYQEEVEFNRSSKGEETIKETADNIACLARKLRDRYNISLVYVILPQKYSLYSARFGDPYDGFIPRLVTEMRKRNVAAVDMYSVYSAQMKLHPDRPLYFGSDTHYNREGKLLLVREIMREITEQNHKRLTNGI